ncbi:MAG: NAD(P)H-binding protein [Bifidobacteriaceae bacterium]|jgi:putative NADH-flavin reductase|nr:NAD(P)H-binding protein [Bifidobacteriaceae bacterium]
MTDIVVFGGTGYAGAAIVAEAVARGHNVRAVARRRPEAEKAVAGAAYLEGSATEPAFLEAACADAEVVISALAPRGPMLGQVRPVNQRLAELADRLGFRLGVILGAGSLQAAPGGPTLAEGPDFPPAFKPEADEMAAVLADLRSSPAGVDWFGVSPAAGFGAFAPGQALGRYRVGGDVMLVDDAGQSQISAADLALAVLDEVERPAHKRARFTVAN